jgi:mannosyltransferase
VSGGCTIETRGLTEHAAPRWQSFVIAVIVVAFAIWVRLPYCTESFWVDELHSAWSVWGSFGEVASRAVMGNQTPVYYWALWVWRQCVGDSELALRMSSVLLSSLACGVVAAGVSQQTRVLVAGAIAGMLLALDPHSLFFGSELRVFAAIMLVGAATLWAWSLNRRTVSIRPAIVLLSLVTLAALIQPTSIGVLGWLAIGPVVMLCRDGLTRQGTRWQWLWIAIVSLAAAMICWQLAGEVLVTAWKHRGQWAAFGSARSFRQVETLWRWKTLAIIPAGLAIVAVVIDRLLDRKANESRATQRIRIGDWAWPFTLVIVATAFFWALSSTGIATVFHRRYMIATLPILAWGGGAAVAHFLATVGNWIDNNRRFSLPPLATAIGLSVVVIIGHAIDQKVSPQTKILRGEGWRSAAGAVQANKNAAARTVLLSPGLIETERFLASGDPAQARYLAFPLSGPYHVPSVEVIQMNDLPQVSAAKIVSGQVDSAILRSSAVNANRWASRIVETAGGNASLSFRHFRFGTIAVIQFDRNRVADPSQ